MLKLMFRRKKKPSIAADLKADMERMDKAVDALAKIAQTQPIAAGSSVLTMIVEAMWAQRQLDDLLKVRESTYMALKKDPFSADLLQRRDRINSDINQLQPVVIQSGLAVADHIEKKYGVNFAFLTGKAVPGAVQPNEKKSSIITDTKSV